MEDMTTDVLIKSLAKEIHYASTKAMCLETSDYSQSGSIDGKALDCS